MAFRVYLDESTDVAVAAALRRCSVDAWTATDAGNRGLTDEQQLAYAAREGAAIFTHDDDFLRIADAWSRLGKRHAGILFVHAEQLAVGTTARRIADLAERLSQEHLLDRVLFL